MEKFNLKKLSREEMKLVKGGEFGGGNCVSECRSGETCKNGVACAMVNCMGVNPTTLYGVC